MGFCENLRDEITYRDIKPKELAALTDVPYHTILCYISKKNNLPNVENAVKIAKALNVSVEYLVTGKDYSSGVPLDKTWRQLQSLPKSIKESITNLISMFYNLVNNFKC